MTGVFQRPQRPTSCRQLRLMFSKGNSTFKVFIFIVSKACPFLIPPTSVHRTPSRFTSAWTLSIKLLLDSPAFPDGQRDEASLPTHSSEGEFGTNFILYPISIIKEDQCDNNFIGSNHTCSPLAPILLNRLEGSVPVWVSNAEKTSHEFADSWRLRGTSHS